MRGGWGLAAGGARRAGGQLAALEKPTTLARRELESLKDRRERLESLKQDTEADAPTSIANVTVESLEKLSPEERNRLYKNHLKLRVVIHNDQHAGG